MFDTTKSPVAPDCVSKVVPRLSLIKVTVAPGIIPPWASFTVPATVAVACAAADDANPGTITVMIAATSRPLHLLTRVMMPPEKESYAARIRDRRMKLGVVSNCNEARKLTRVSGRIKIILGVSTPIETSEQESETYARVRQNYRRGQQTAAESAPGEYSELTSHRMEMPVEGWGSMGDGARRERTI